MKKVLVCCKLLNWRKIRRRGIEVPGQEKVRLGYELEAPGGGITSSYVDNI